MNLKENFVSSFMAFEGNIDVNTDLHNTRIQSIQNFEAKGFPTQDQEEWKQTSLEAIVNDNFTLFSQKGNSIDFLAVKNYFLHEIDTYKLVFVDGIFNSFLSTTTHDGVDICLMSSALTRPKYKNIIDNYFNQIADTKESLISLNTAFADEGAYINIPENKIVEKPIEIVCFSTGGNNLWTQPRNLIIVGKNAHVQIIERHQCLSDNKVMTNSVTEIFAHDRATVDYYKIQDDAQSANLIDNTYISQKTESHVIVHTFSFGGNLTRNNLNFYHFGERLTSTLNGITIIKENQHVDHHTSVNHKEPNCESFQDYKGIFNGKSKGIFNGKIRVGQLAQKTNAFQKSNNIALSNDVTINAKPQLEIFADDVKCSHGCTIGQLDETALFYLQSRGIPKKEASALLLYAFSNSIIEGIKIPEIKSRITKIIAQKLNVEMGFDL